MTVATVISASFGIKSVLKRSGKTINFVNAQDGYDMKALKNIPAEMKLGKTKIIWLVCLAPIRDNIVIGSRGGS